MKQSNAGAYLRALDSAMEWMYKADMYYAVGNMDMHDFCNKVAEHFIKMSTRLI